MADIYRFNKSTHLHEIFDGKEWRPATGITTVLSVISKPALIDWAANEAVNFISENFEGELTPELLRMARSAHIRKKEEAGQKGTDIHTEAEKIIKEAIKTNSGFIPEELTSEIPQIQKLLDWAKMNKVKFLESELNLYSVNHFLGGICDFVCEIDGEIWIGDLKTSSDIYPEFFWQMAGYQILAEEMGIYPGIKGHIILNLRKDGGFAEKRSISNEDNKDAFLACLKIYRIRQKVEGNLI